MDKPCGDYVDGYWDDLENELRLIRNALDDADSTKFGEMGRLLDTMSKRADRALRYAELLRHPRGIGEV